ncbi:recombinase family protein [Sphingobium sp. HBC34]|uniref:Recombinase family protein n=1 Tax=Sphingobium cyanobacteriorum TaxID=3063954 RepID=A0ABT8ZTE9_9SPHN|nr:recombinase family protein [Sphingobium sp. HBC34]MDO7837517.1 recombinase family protein [Sphingobium sp. HBC34]
MKTVFAYIRVSTVKQGMRGSSLQEQQSAIRAYAERHALVVSEWFEEQETAAKRGRPVFARMLKMLDRGCAEGVVIHKIDRGARNLKDWADLGELMDRGVALHFAHESLDLSSRGGRLAADIQAVVAADFIRNLRDEVRKGFLGRLKQGLYPLPAPIGYTDQGRGLPKLPDPVIGPLVRQVFELYATGRYNLALLEAEAYHLGLRNRRGGRVTRNGFSKLLNNEFYMGIIHIRRTGDRYVGAHDPLVSSTLFQTVQAVLRGRKIQTDVRHDFVYRKRITCVSCGYRLIGERQKGHVYYRCHTHTCPSTSLRESAIDEQMEGILSRITIPEVMHGEIAWEFERLRATDQQGPKEAERQARLRLGQIDQTLGRLTDGYVDQTIERDLYLSRKADLLVQRVRVTEQLSEMSLSGDRRRLKVTQFLELLKRLGQRHGDLFSEEKRELMNSVTSNLRASQKNLLFDWKTGFDVIEKWCDKYCGVPEQDARRRSEKLPQEAIPRLVRDLYTALRKVS